MLDVFFRAPAGAATLAWGRARAVEPFTVRDIRVEGLQRVEPGTAASARCSPWAIVRRSGAGARPAAPGRPACRVRAGRGRSKSALARPRSFRRRAADEGMAAGAFARQARGRGRLRSRSLSTAK